MTLDVSKVIIHYNGIYYALLGKVIAYMHENWSSDPQYTGKCMAGIVTHFVTPKLGSKLRDFLSYLAGHVSHNGRSYFSEIPHKILCGD